MRSASEQGVFDDDEQKERRCGQGNDAEVRSASKQRYLMEVSKESAGMEEFP